VSNAVYRMFDEAGDLLYIGKSNQFMGRVHQHAETKGWWPEVANISITHYPCRCTAEDAERDAIVAEMPKYNVHHNGARISRDHSMEIKCDLELPAPVDNF
jgi:excinuclease UvrABC nuclease subunit